jgi:NAD(P)-dependent dehydrogenase (short-subunit alcohol dehydrogenase family)
VADIETELATNLLGPMLSPAAPCRMPARHSGTLISSMNAVQPRPLQIGYTAAKAGVEGVAHTLRLDLEGTGVRSLIVRPGPTRSEFGFGWPPEMLVRVIESWQRWGLMRHNDMLDPEHIAAAVVSAATAPAAAHLDVIQLNPTGPIHS